MGRTVQTKQIVKEQDKNSEIRARKWAKLRPYGTKQPVIEWQYNNDEAADLGLVAIHIGKEVARVRVDELLFVLRNVY